MIVCAAPWPWDAGLYGTVGRLHRARPTQQRNDDDDRAGADQPGRGHPPAVANGEDAQRRRRYRAVVARTSG